MPTTTLNVSTFPAIATEFELAAAEAGIRHEVTAYEVTSLASGAQISFVRDNTARTQLTGLMPCPATGTPSGSLVAIADRSEPLFAAPPGEGIIITKTGGTFVTGWVRHRAVRTAE